MTRFPFFAAIVIVFWSAAPAQSVDTLRTGRDSLERIDPVPNVGWLDPIGTSASIITSRDITIRDYRSLYDILADRPGVFVRDLASPGQKNQLVIYGIDDKNIAVMIDGIPYNDFYTGSANLWSIPVESIERVEMFTGAQSMFYDGASAGSVINIVTKDFNNNRAITALRYSQGVSAYSQTDAMFAQNVASGVNLSMALSHYGFGSSKESQSYRARFDNSNHDLWNFRAKVRYDYSSYISLLFSYIYDRSWTGLFGGVNYRNTSSIYDGLTATVINSDAYEKQYNSHYRLTAAYFPFSDSSLLAAISGYSYDRLREYRDEENRTISRNSIIAADDFSSAGRGVNVRLRSSHSAFNVLGYADLLQINNNNIITLGIKTEIFPGSFVSVTPFATIKDYQSQFVANGGAEATITFSRSLSLFGSIGQNIVSKLSGAGSSSPTTYSAGQRTKETFSVISGGVRYRSGTGMTAEFSYQRTIQYDPIIFDTISFSGTPADLNYYFPKQFSFQSVSSRVHVQWGEFHTEGSGMFLQQPSIQRNGKAVTRYPDLVLNGSVYYKGLLANGNLDLRTGIRGNFFSEQTGMTPLDRFGVWMPSTILTYGPGGSIDFFAVGKIGDAYVHLIWENLTGNQYLLAPVYPLYERNIRFGVTWQFID